MTKQNKNIFGLLGLLMVAFTTVFAAILPPVSAIGGMGGTDSITDTIVVRVIGSNPEVLITSPIGFGSQPIEFVRPDQPINFKYINVSELDFYLTYTDLDGNVTEEHISL